jgi:hypothetical protein
VTDAPKTVLLHIGTAKTGTTSVQRWLAHAEEQGSLAPIRYPLWQGGHNHQRLASLYLPFENLPPTMRQNYGPDGEDYRRMRQRYRAFLFGELSAASGAILSGESLCDLLSPLLAGRLRQDLESLGFREFAVVLHIRDPADYFLSATQQDLKTSVRSPFVQDPAEFRYEFLRMTQTWEQAFPGRLIVSKFPADQGYDAVEDFAVVMQRCFGSAPPRLPLRMNTTQSAEAMQIIQDYRLTFGSGANVPTRDVARLVEFLDRSRQDVRQTRPVLKPEIAEQIRASHRDDAAELLSRYGVDLGLQNCGPVSIPDGKPCRVDEILESVNPEVVYELLLRLAGRELGRERSVSVAARAYRRIPPAYRPVRTMAWVRSRISRADR